MMIHAPGQVLASTPTDDLGGTLEESQRVQPVIRYDQCTQQTMDVKRIYRYIRETISQTKMIHSDKNDVWVQYGNQTSSKWDTE